tara:strand:- start:3425 stop:4234 length:810 start_codon:yes stop_codon:yes gene_type:complete
MKTAVCIHGLARGSSVAADGAYLEKFSSLRKQIKKSDVFIHSWDTDIEQELLEIFNPVKSIFEPQKNFEKEISMFGDIDMYSTNTSPKQGEIFKTLSFLYSRMMSIQLKKQTENKNRFEYDCVLTCRFDVGHHNGGRNKTSHMRFNRNLDMSKIYQSDWEQTDAGASDHWFYSNSKNIDMIGDMYNKLWEYLNPDSKYAKLCKEGWPLSDAGNEFSNQIFKQTRSHNLKKLTSGNTILVNNHSIYKHHLMENNMWDNGNSVFIKGWQDD